jgi:transcriptional regulator with XRE-family HTH domain
VINASHLVRQARRAAGLTQAELARRLDRPQSVVARLEAPGANPKVETLNNAVAATGLSIQVGMGPPSGIDESMIAEELQHTADQRLRNFESLYGFAREFGGAALDRSGP